jgi:hypothetical protein
VLPIVGNRRRPANSSLPKGIFEQFVQWPIVPFQTNLVAISSTNFLAYSVT